MLNVLNSCYKPNDNYWTKQTQSSLKLRMIVQLLVLKLKK